MAELTALFGGTILTKDGPKPTTEALANKTHVMVYFSAHWVRLGGTTCAWGGVFMTGSIQAKPDQCEYARGRMYPNYP